MALFFSEAGSSPCEPSKNEKKKGFNLFGAWIFRCWRSWQLYLMPHWIVPVVVSIHGLLQQLVPSRLVYLFIMPQRRDGGRRIPRKPLEHALGFFRALWNFVVCHVLREMLVLIWRLVLLISLGIYKTLCLKILLCTSTFFRTHLLL